MGWQAEPFLAKTPKMPSRWPSCWPAPPASSPRRAAGGKTAEATRRGAAGGKPAEGPHKSESNTRQRATTRSRTHLHVQPPSE